MNKEQFIDLLEMEGWDWADHIERDVPGIAFKKMYNGKEIMYHMSDDGINRVDIAGMTKKLRGHNVDHITRIVEYYSKVHNWNKSKLGELRDRHNGNYVL